MGDLVQNHLSFSEELGLLKHIERKGWVLRGVPCPERVAVSVSFGHLLYLSWPSFDHCLTIVWP